MEKLPKKKRSLEVLMILAALIFGAVYLFLDMDRTPDHVITLDGYEMKINSTTVEQLEEAGFSVSGGPVVIGPREFTTFSYEVKKGGEVYGRVGLANYGRGDEMAKECTVISYYFNRYSIADAKTPLLNGKDCKGWTIEQAQQELGEPDSTFEYSSETKYEFGKKKKNIEMVFEKSAENQISSLYVEYKVQ